MCPPQSHHTFTIPTIPSDVEWIFMDMVVFWAPLESPGAPPHEGLWWYSTSQGPAVRIPRGDPMLFQGIILHHHHGSIMDHQYVLAGRIVVVVIASSQCNMSHYRTGCSVFVWTMIWKPTASHGLTMMGAPYCLDTWDTLSSCEIIFEGA